MSNKSGSSWVELVLILGCILVIAIIVFIVLNPVYTRATLRDEARLGDVSLLLEGFIAEHLENQEFLQELPNNTPIQIGTAEKGCERTCELVASTKCFNANIQVLKHTGEIPVDPSIGTQEKTGYYVLFTDTSELLLGSCNPETQEVISVSKQFFISVEN